jgi:hypothetical protein
MLAVLGIVCAGSALALDAPRKVVDYQIEVSFKPETRALEGRETLRWTNPSEDAVAELWFHLYWNAFRNNRSTLVQEVRRWASPASEDVERWGFIDVTALRWEGRDLLPAARFAAPDDGNVEDRTVLVVPLSRAVAPGETIALDIAWKAKAPHIIVRAGQVREYLFAGQWFPKIGVYEPAGRRGRTSGGWNCHQYHAESEFYADWGDYRVTITLPERFVVAAAGKLVGERHAGASKTLTFQQDAIHDFAWSADPRFVVREDVFDPARDLPEDEVQRAAKLLGRTPAELRRGIHPVRLRFCMQPDHESQWMRYCVAQKWALAWLGLHVFPYPYDQVTVVDPPEDGANSAGMEYQTLYTAGTTKWRAYWPLSLQREPEGVVIHEFGHGYFYGLLASNEFEEAWLDEGINSFVEAEMVDRKYGYFFQFLFGIGFSDHDMSRWGAILTDYDPIIAPAWAYSDRNAYFINSYARPAVTLEQIRALLGEEKFWRAFRAYAERWRWDHPGSDDFFAVMRSAARGAVAAPALEELIAKVFHGVGSISLRVLSAGSRPVGRFVGFNDKAALVKPDEKADAKKGRGKDARKDETYLARVVVGRTGDVALPTDIRLTFADGSVQSVYWDGQTRWVAIERTAAAKLTKVEVDPDHRLILNTGTWKSGWVSGDYNGPSAAQKVRTYLLAALTSVLATVAGIL